MAGKSFLLFVPFLLLALIGFGGQFVHMFALLKTAWLLKFGFYPALAFSMALTFLFVRQDSYFAILRHELIHNFFAILSFQKPHALVVQKGRGGQFTFTGRENIFITLSPYFFPLLTSFWLPVALLSVDNKNAYGFVLGILLGMDVVMSVKDIHIHQTDFKRFGIAFSILFICLFSFIFWGSVFAFAGGGLTGAGLFLRHGFANSYEIIPLIFKYLTHK